MWPYGCCTDTTLHIPGSSYCCEDKQKKRGFGGGSVFMHGYGLLVNVYRWKCMSSLWPVSGWNVPLSTENCWARLQRNGEINLFLCEFEQFWPALHVPVSLASEFGSGPCFVLKLPLPAFLLLHLLFKSSFLTRCTGPHTKGIIISLVFWIPIKLCVKRVKKCADCESEPPQVLPSASVLCQVIASNFLTLHGR